MLSIGIRIKQEKPALREGLKALSEKTYPGRIIIIGKEKTGKNTVVIYAITGRSPSSQGRRLVREGDTLWVKPTEEELIKKAKSELLLYPAMCLSRGIVVGNGRQIFDVKSRLALSENPSEILAQALSGWSYESDDPFFTPRISGCILPQRAAFSIIKRGEEGSVLRNIFEVPLVDGQGFMISTYKGEDMEHLEPFSGEPQKLLLAQIDCRDAAEAVYEALGPKSGEKDLRVALACVFSPDLESGVFEMFIVNRNERMGSFHG